MAPLPYRTVIPCCRRERLAVVRSLEVYIITHHVALAVSFELQYYYTNAAFKQRSAGGRYLHNIIIVRARHLRSLKQIRVYRAGFTLACVHNVMCYIYADTIKQVGFRTSHKLDERKTRMVKNSRVVFCFTRTYKLRIIRCIQKKRKKKGAAHVHRSEIKVCGARFLWTRKGLCVRAIYKYVHTHAHIYIYTDDVCVCTVCKQSSN